MNNTILINEFTKCRLENIFGDGTYFGCFTITKLVIAVGMAGLVMLILGILMKLNNYLLLMKGGIKQDEKI